MAAESDGPASSSHRLPRAPGGAGSACPTPSPSPSPRSGSADYGRGRAASSPSRRWLPPTPRSVRQLEAPPPAPPAGGRSASSSSQPSWAAGGMPIATSSCGCSSLPAHRTRRPRSAPQLPPSGCAAEKKLGGVPCRCFILGAGSLDHAIRDKLCVDDRATRCRCLLWDGPFKKTISSRKDLPFPKPSKVVNIVKVQREELLNTHIDTNSSFDMISNLPPFHTRP